MLRYYKEVIIPNLEEKKYLSILISIKKKIIVARIKVNSHKIHSEIGHWTIPKMLWVKGIYHLCDAKVPM